MVDMAFLDSGGETMQAQMPPQSGDYARVIAAIVARMPIERAAQVYDFVRFLQEQPASTLLIEAGDDDWLNDDESRMAAEDEQWEATYERHHEKFAALAEAARAEIAANTTQSMFDEDGNFVLK